jgi:hypothetical protein
VLMSVKEEDRAGESFEQIEAAVLETRRGRWFLEELVRRSRASDTAEILNAIRKLEGAVSPAATIVPAHDAAQQITAARREIAGIRNDKLPGGGSWPDDGAVFDKLAVQARECAGALGARIEDLQDAIAKCEHKDGQGSQSPAIRDIVSALETVGFNQDLLARRVARVCNLLSQLSLGTTLYPVQYVPPQPVSAPPPVPPLAVSEKPAPKLERQHLQYFRQDEEIFEPAKGLVADTPPPPPPPPVVIERKPAPIATERPEEPKGARLIIRRVAAPEGADETVLAPPSAPLAATPEPVMAELPAPPPPEPAKTAERPRIVVMKTEASSAIDIPVPGTVAEETAA